MKVIIVGNGPAGNSIASKLDKAGVEVELYSDEAVGFYSRLRLPSALGDIKKLEALCSKSDPKFLKHFGVIAINKEEKTVLLSSGENSSYDKLVIATGSNAKCFYTDSGLKGIFTLRTYHDGIQLTKKLSDPVVVLGGGLLGLETALVINNLGFSVTVVEGGAHVLFRQLDKQSASIITEKCTSRNNFNIICGVFADKVEGNKNIESIVLKDGTVLPCKTLVIAAGVIPSTSLAKNCGLDIDRAIIVDDTCKTSDDNIYAIGDCAQYNGICPGLMP
ncbi:MAG: FAD-dependent oxidoreductase, partial [Spirochaetaceae bacterium]|nr:FAD-dependent oxidoreductase [Spirochaetaceae bacterium]